MLQFQLIVCLPSLAIFLKKHRVIGQAAQQPPATEHAGGQRDQTDEDEPVDEESFGVRRVIRSNRSPECGRPQACEEGSEKRPDLPSPGVLEKPGMLPLAPGEHFRPRKAMPA